MILSNTNSKITVTVDGRVVRYTEPNRPLDIEFDHPPVNSFEGSDVIVINKEDAKKIHEYLERIQYYTDCDADECLAIFHLEAALKGILYSNKPGYKEDEVMLTEQCCMSNEQRRKHYGEQCKNRYESI